MVFCRQQVVERPDHDLPNGLDPFDEGPAFWGQPDHSFAFVVLILFRFDKTVFLKVLQQGYGGRMAIADLVGELNDAQERFGVKNKDHRKVPGFEFDAIGLIDEATVFAEVLAEALKPVCR